MDNNLPSPKETIIPDPSQPLVPQTTLVDSKAINGDQKSPSDQPQKSEATEQNHGAQEDGTNLKFGQRPKNVICPYCGESVRTEVKSQENVRCELISLMTCCLGFITFGICCLVGCVLGCVLLTKKHICPKCQKELGKYDPTAFFYKRENAKN